MSKPGVAILVTMNSKGPEASFVADVLEECGRRLRSLVDPERENRRAFDDQAALIERLGGVEAILRSDEFDFTPVPAGHG